MAKFILLIISTMFLMSCNQPKNRIEEKKISTQAQIETDLIKKSLYITVEPNLFKLSLIPDTVKVEMKNNTKDTITTGEYYRIEHFEGDQWFEVSPEQTFVDIGFSLHEGDSKFFEVKLLKERIEYEVGKYRIVKHYSKPNYQETKEEFNVFGEFNIE